MPGLTWSGLLDRLAGRRPGRRDDRGAVAVIVAMLLAGGVLLGFLALVIDVGQLYVERQQLQSGADNAAIAVAKACSIDTADCANSGAAIALAEHYADANADDKHSHVAEVCGRVPGNKLPDCSPPATNLTACIKDAPATDSYVEVRLTTEMGDGSFVLPPVFAQAVAGNEHYAGTSVGACGRAGWESSVNVLSMTISRCEYDAVPHKDVAPASADANDEYNIMIWQDPFDCSDIDLEDNYSPPPGWGDGQLGFINTDDSCTRPIPDDGNVDGQFWEHRILTVLPQSCETTMRQLIATQTSVYLPVYDEQTLPGGEALFHIGWLVRFTVTGFEWGPPDTPEDGDHDEASRLTGNVPCIQFYERCVSGFFTGPLLPLTSAVPTNDSIVKLIG